MLSESTEVFIEFSKAFEEALPDLEKTDLDWRSHFMAGAMAHTLCNSDLLTKFTQTNANDSELETTIQRLIDFTAGGFRAKVSKTSKPKKSK